jgi:hypothetical protein
MIYVHAADDLIVVLAGAKLTAQFGQILAPLNLKPSPLESNPVDFQNHRRLLASFVTEEPSDAFQSIARRQLMGVPGTPGECQNKQEGRESFYWRRH